MLFLTLLVTARYRMRLPGFELPESVIATQRVLDDDLARALETMADRIEGRSSRLSTFLARADLSARPKKSAPNEAAPGTPPAQALAS